MYVFGVDLPLMEILFVFSILYLVGLIIVFFEIRKLRKLLMIERLDLKELHDDVSELNKDVSALRKYFKK